MTTCGSPVFPLDGGGHRHERTPVTAAVQTQVVSAEGLTKSWGARTVLTDLDLQVGHGVTGLLGPNGSGKTTLIGMLLGLHAPDHGSLRVLGLDPRQAGPLVRARVGYAPQHDALPPEIEALDLVRHLGEVHGLPVRAARQRASDVLWLVGLGEERRRPVGTMSGGQRQRVKLAAALVHDPSLLVLDEPTNGLDPGQRDGVLHLVRRLADELAVPVIMSSHLLEEVERTCDQVIVLSEGRAVLQRGLAELRVEARQSEDHVLLVELDSGAEPLAGRLREAGLPATATGRRVLIHGSAPGVDPAPVVLEVVEAMGLGLRRMQVRTRSLEDVFLDLAPEGGGQ